MAKSERIPFHHFIAQQIAMSSKQQKEIAADLGYEKPNVMTMFKKGTTRVPINKIVPLALSLGIDPTHMLRLAMEEYMPETWAIIEPYIGRDLVSKEEYAGLEAIREASHGVPVDFTTARNREPLIALIEKLAREENARNDASLASYAARPTNKKQG